MASFGDVVEGSDEGGLHHLETPANSMASFGDEGSNEDTGQLETTPLATPPDAGDAETTGASEAPLGTLPDDSGTGNGGDPYETSYDSDDDDTTPSKKKSQSTDSKSKPLAPIHFVRATCSSGDDDTDHRPSSFPPACCTYYYEPPQPPEPGSLASNQIVAKMMARMNYEEGTGLGKYGHGIINPIVATFKYRKGGLGTVELGPYHRLAVDMPSEPKIELEPESPHAETFAIAMLQRQGAKYAAARAREWRHIRVRAAHMRGSSPSTYDGRDEKTSAKTEVIRALAVVRKESALGTLTLGGLIHEFSGLKEKFPEVYRTCRLGYKAIRLAAPLIRSLVCPRYGTREPPNKSVFVFIRALRDIVEDDASPAAKSAYDQLVNDIVLETMKASSWDAMDPQPMVRFVNTWKDTLKPSTMGFILEKIVLPALVSSAEVWSPEWWSTVPANVWVSPWIPHLGHARLQSVYKAIGRQLGESTCKWGVTHNDYCNVFPWKEVFDPASWDEFVEEYVVPLLRKSLRDVKISPMETWGKSNPFPLIMNWARLVPVKYMLPLLQEEFFGKWRNATYRLLMRSLPEQATAWYETWKGLFTPELLAEERVLVQLETGLDMINRAAWGLNIIKPEH